MNIVELTCSVFSMLEERMYQIEEDISTPSEKEKEQTWIPEEDDYKVGEEDTQ